MAFVVLSGIDRILPIYGGAGIRILKVAQKLRQEGHKVVILAPSTRKELDGMKIYPLPYPTEGRFQVLSIFFFNLQILLILAGFVTRVDLFIVHNTTAGITISLLSHLLRKRFILDVTDFHTEYLIARDRSFFEKLLTPCLRLIDYSIMKSADSVIAVTKNMKTYLAEKGVDAKKINVVYDGAEVGKHTSVKNSGAESAVIHLGTMDRQHGVDLFVRAIPEILRKYPSLRFYFVGGGRIKNRIKELAESLNAGRHCTFTGQVSYEQVGEHLARASIGVISRPDILANNQVVTVKLFEYWASGTAVVSSRLRGICEIAKDGDNILFFEPGNVRDLAGKIIFLIEHPDIRRKLQENGLKTVKQFDWEELSKQIVEISLCR